MAEKAGEHVERDEPLFEISTDKVDTEIPSPAAGTLAEILVEEGKTVASTPSSAASVTAIDGASAPAPCSRRASSPHPHPASARLPGARSALPSAAPASPSRPRIGRNADRAAAAAWSKKPPDRFRRWCARWRARIISI